MYTEEKKREKRDRLGQYICVDVFLTVRASSFPPPYCSYFVYVVKVT